MKRVVPAAAVAATLVLSLARLSFAPSGGLGCSKCDAHVVSTTVSPPAPCLNISTQVCNLSGETLQIQNRCVSPAAEDLVLTSNDFQPAASPLSFDGSASSSQDDVPAGSIAQFIATPTADQQTTLSLTGTLGGNFITITILLTTGPVTVDASSPVDATVTTDAPAAADTTPAPDAPASHDAGPADAPSKADTASSMPDAKEAQASMDAAIEAEAAASSGDSGDGGGARDADARAVDSASSGG